MVVCGDLWWFVVICGRLRWFALVCGRLRWFAVVCGRLRWFVVVCLIVIRSHTDNYVTMQLCFLISKSKHFPSLVTPGSYQTSTNSIRRACRKIAIRKIKGPKINYKNRKIKGPNKDSSSTRASMEHKS